MRKELTCILLFFGFIFTFLSLTSYTPADPSLNSAGASLKGIHNIFGVIGAYISGMFIGLFGIGAFWIPLLFLMSCIRVYKAEPSAQNMYVEAGGVLLLLISTGSLFALGKNSYRVFGTSFSSGGIIGIALKSFLVQYSNPAGSAIILIVLFVIALMLAANISVMQFMIKLWNFYLNDAKESFETSDAELPQPYREQSPSEPRIAEPPKIKEKKAPEPKMIVYMPDKNGFQMPGPDFLDEPEPYQHSDPAYLTDKAKLLESKLQHFGIKGKVSEVIPGPVITTFEYEPAPGVKINKIVSLSDDLALALRAMTIRIVAPIPGKSVIGIEIPNEKIELVRLKELVASEEFKKSKSKLTICLGKDIEGKPVVAELDKMPHLLIAGATGTGKSVGLNAMICSLLYKSFPDEVRFIMVDPKRIELSMYDDIPHLAAPVVTDVHKATNALFWAVREMERRYELLSEKKVRNIDQYNTKIIKEKIGNPLPYIVIIIDELADLMMVSSKDVEVSLTRLAQMARTAGMHLILATQRPSVDVLTGTIKANFPTRLSFKVSSKIDSRTIIDGSGAETLLGNGDMLFLPPGSAVLRRIQGAYISEDEVSKITEFLKSQRAPEYDHSVLEPPSLSGGDTARSEHDDRYEDAVELVSRMQQVSVSLVQRHLKVGHKRAAKIIELMEKEGVIAGNGRSKEVLIRNQKGVFED